MDLIYAQLLQVSTLGGERTYQCVEDSVVAGKAERMGGWWSRPRHKDWSYICPHLVFGSTRHDTYLCTIAPVTSVSCAVPCSCRKIHHYSRRKMTSSDLESSQKKQAYQSSKIRLRKFKRSALEGRQYKNSYFYLYFLLIYRSAWRYRSVIKSIIYRIERVRIIYMLFRDGLNCLKCISTYL